MTEYRSIKEITHSIFSGGTPNTFKNEYWGGSIPWFSSGETRNNFILETEKKITQLGVDNSATKLALRGDTVVATAGQGNTRGQVSFCLIDTYINQSTIALRPNEDLIEPLFLYYYLKSRYRELRQISDSSSSRGSITKSVIAEVKVSILPKPQQKKICKTLYSLDKKNLRNHELSKILEKISNNIFRSWFIDFSGHVKFEGSELGDIPKGWKVKKIKELVKEKPSGVWGSDSKFENSMPIICLRGTDLIKLKKNGFANNAPRRWVTKQSLKGREITENDIILGGSGMGPVGKTVYFAPEIKKLYENEISYSNFCKCFSVESSQLAIYLEKYLEFMYKTVQLEQFFTGTSIPNFDVEGLLDEPIIIPPPNLIEKYAKFAKILFSSLYNKEKLVLDLLRDHLVSKLVSGEFRV